MPATAVRQPIVGLGLLGGLLVVAAFAAPSVISGADPAEVAHLVTRQTARVPILFWGIAAAALLLRLRDLGRAAWTVGGATFVVHVATAFDRVHGWSHAAAWEHVETVSGFGSGLFVSYAFTILWVTDVAWWWADRTGYDSRPGWLDRAVHGFLAFVVFNATVIYATGFIRWAGIVLFSLLGLLIFARRRPVVARP